MKISEERKKELQNMGYGKLQSTEEYKDFLSKYVYSQSKLMNEEVEYILKKSVEDSDAPFSYDDLDLSIWNTESAKDDIKEEIKNDSDIDSETKQKLLNELKDIEDIDELENFTTDNLISFDKYDYEEQAEVYQWFMMDERLLRQLEEREEIVLNGTYWGRQCCGQAIELDGVIIEIFKEWYLNLYGV